MDEWIDVTEPDDLARQLGLDPEEVRAATELYSAAMMVQGSELWWRTEDGQPTLSGSGQPGFEYQIFRSRVYFNVTAARNVWGDLIIIGLVYASTASWPLATALAAVRKLADTLRSLSEDEAELVGVIRGLAKGNPYKSAVPETAVRAAYRDATVDVLSLLDALESKDVIKRQRPDSIVLVL